MFDLNKQRFVSPRPDHITPPACQMFFFHPLKTPDYNNTTFPTHHMHNSGFIHVCSPCVWHLLKVIVIVLMHVNVCAVQRGHFSFLFFFLPFSVTTENRSTFDFVLRFRSLTHNRVLWSSFSLLMSFKICHTCASSLVLTHEVLRHLNTHYFLSDIKTLIFWIVLRSILLLICVFIHSNLVFKAL